MVISARAALPLALLLAAACARTRVEEFSSPPHPPEVSVRDSVSVSVRGPGCAEQTLTALLKAPRVAAALWPREAGGELCSASISVESVAGDSVVLRFRARTGETEVDQPIVARRGSPRHYELAAGVRLSAWIREFGPGA